MDKLEIVARRPGSESLREAMATTSSVQGVLERLRANTGLEIHLPPRAGAHQPHAQPGRLRKPVPAFSSGQGAREIPAGSGLLLSRIDLLLAFHCPGGHRRSADVLLPPGRAPGLPGYEGPAICGFQRGFPSQSSPAGGATDGARRVLAHVPRFLPRRLQASARIQLGGRCVSC